MSERVVGDRTFELKPISAPDGRRNGELVECDEHGAGRILDGHGLMPALAAGQGDGRDEFERAACFRCGGIGAGVEIGGCFNRLDGARGPWAKHGQDNRREEGQTFESKHRTVYHTVLSDAISSKVEMPISVGIW